MSYGGIWVMMNIFSNKSCMERLDGGCWWEHFDGNYRHDAAESLHAFGGNSTSDSGTK